MNIYVFIYIVCSYAVSIVLQAYSNIPIEFQIMGSALLLLCIGIPHGTLDHLLTFNKQETNPLKFYVYYLGAIVLYLLLWIVSPSIGLVSFLLVSAFHFGETQLHFFFKTKSKLQLLIYLNWGISILFTLIYYNSIELGEMTTSFDDTQVFLALYEHEILKPIFMVSNALSLASFALMYLGNSITSQTVLSEVFFLAVIHLTAFLFPFIICFTLYFIVLHSLPSIVHQFSFFKKLNKKFSVMRLIKLMAPYSILSILMSSILICLSYLNYLPISIPLVSLIVISVITLPHAVVMYKFNQ
jgi:beta-carotene 15,15'-dioxygenase